MGSGTWVSWVALPTFLVAAAGGELGRSSVGGERRAGHSAPLTTPFRPPSTALLASLCPPVVPCTHATRTRLELFWGSHSLCSSHTAAQVGADMPSGSNLDVSLRAINGGELPSSERLLTYVSQSDTGVSLYDTGLSVALGGGGSPLRGRPGRRRSVRTTPGHRPTRGRERGILGRD